MVGQSNAELQIPGYQITRLDRQTGEHGGILLNTKDGIDVQIREDPVLAEYAEALWCYISSPGSELIYYSALCTEVTTTLRK